MRALGDWMDGLSPVQGLLLLLALWGAGHVLISLLPVPRRWR